MGTDWKWLFRLQCKMIASSDVRQGVIVIRLCKRWRWHKGVCRA